MSNPRVSIVMSCYDAAHTLRRAVDSMLQQSYSNFEFIIVDDGSTDETLVILKKYQIEDERIHLIVNENNLGLAASLNKGIKKSKGEYIARMDADDESLLHRLEQQVSFLDKQEHIDILGTGIVTRTAASKEVAKHVLPEIHRDIIANVFKKPLVFHPTIMVRKNIFEKHGYYDPAITWAEDADLWYRVYDKVRFHNLQEPLLYYTLKQQFRWRHAKQNILVKIDHLKKRNKLLMYAPQLMYDVLNFGRKMISPSN